MDGERTIWPPTSMICLGTHGILKTGHNHEIINAMFGQWVAWLINQKTMQTPTWFMNALQTHVPDTGLEILDYKRGWSETGSLK